MEQIRLGQITAAVGLKGELRVYPYTDYKEKFEELPHVLLDGVTRKVEKLRYQKNMVVLKLTGIDDRTAAEAQQGKYLFIGKEDAGPLPEGTYYVKDLLGLEVTDEGGAPVGTLKDVIKNTLAQDLYEIEMENGKTFLLPAVEAFVKEIDMEDRRMVIHLIEGLVEG